MKNIKKWLITLFFLFLLPNVYAFDSTTIATSSTINSDSISSGYALEADGTGGTTWAAVQPLNTNLTSISAWGAFQDVQSTANPSFVGLMLTNGSLGINTNGISPATKLEAVETISTSPRGIMSAQYSNDTSSARLHLRKARGTISTPTTIVTGDLLGRIVTSGYDGTNYLEMGSMGWTTTGTVGTNRIPTIFTIQTATDASPSVLTDRVIVDSAGNVGIGVTPTATLHVAGQGLFMPSVTTGLRLGYPNINSEISAYGTNSNIELRLTSKGTGGILLNYNNSTATGSFVYYGGTTGAKFSVDSNGKGYFAENVGIGTSIFGTSASKILAQSVGIAPTTSPASTAQKWVQIVNGVAGTASFHQRSEEANSATAAENYQIIDGTVIKSTTGDLGYAHEALGVINTNDLRIRRYLNGAWRTTTDWNITPVHLSAQTADISATAMNGAALAGSYILRYYIQTTTADAAAGTFSLTIAWTDDAGATSVAVPLTLASTGRLYGNVPIRLASGNITYAVTHTGSYGTAAYRIDITGRRED